MDGNSGVASGALSLTNVDVVSDHYYGSSLGNVGSEANSAASGGKAFCACEFDWNNTDTTSFLATTLSNTNVAGDLFWEIMPTDENYSYVRNYPLLDFVYPGLTSTMQTRSTELRNHIYAMQGITAPSDGLPGTPVITSVNGNAISWRVGVLGNTYTIERSPDGASNWTTICNQCVGDNGSPWTDASQPSGTQYYRITGYNRSGGAGAPSAVYTYSPPTGALPSGWSQADVGGPSVTGNATYANQTFTVAGAGNDIGATADQFHFVYQSLTGDGTIIAHVASVATTDDAAKAGVMIRASLDAGATTAFMDITPNTNDNFIARTSTGGTATNTTRSIAYKQSARAFLGETHAQRFDLHRL